MSLKKIAEITGASVSTVSRVLNSPGYRARNRELENEIRETARVLNYVPNASARQLKKGVETSDCAQLDILLARVQSLEEDAFFEEIYRHLTAEAMQQQCKIRLILKEPDIVRMEAQRERARAQGLIVLGKCPEHLHDILHRRYRAIVAIDRNPSEYKMDEVVCSGARAAEIVVEYLWELGHRKIAYIGNCNMEARYTGYYECLLRHKLPLRYDYVVATGQTMEEGYLAYDRLAKEGCRPGAVFCANDVTALGFLKAMNEKTGRKKDGYRPAVASIDDIEAASKCSPMLTTLNIPKQDMAHMAVLMIKDRLAGGHREYLRLEVPCRLIVRESAGMYVLQN